MSYQYRDRRSRLRGFHSVYGNGKIKAANLQIEPVHLIPEKIQRGDEFDFWFNNGKDIFLVTLERSLESRIFSQRIQRRSHLSLRVKLDFNRLTRPDIIKIFELISDLGLSGNKFIRLSRPITSPI